ncbi:DUF4276 family protein [Pseudomonas sp. JV241A]|uniref:DUF4276 family protein n=1 Tax=Pseudomonas sp. JV241A TaxID=2078785 RepID=UPI0010653671|nr:DUF4276 family protein [Pseudomonas sp. JV241A]
MNIVFMLEEPSMKHFLAGFIGRLFPEHFTVTYLVHEGKQDLEKSIPRKLRGWQVPNSYFIIVRDKDGEDPLVLKARLRELCADRPESLIRIPVHHLESWILGDLPALAIAFNKPSLVALAGNRKFRSPDSLANASQELAKLIPGYQKVGGARSVSPHVNIENNLSRSFNLFIRDVKRLAGIEPV